MPCISGIHNRRKLENLGGGWCFYIRKCVCVCVCVCVYECVCVCVCVMSLGALRFHFPVWVMFLYNTHEADTLGRNWYAFLTAGRNSYVPLWNYRQLWHRALSFPCFWNLFVVNWLRLLDRMLSPLQDLCLHRTALPKENLAIRVWVGFGTRWQFLRGRRLCTL